MAGLRGTLLFILRDFTDGFWGLCSSLSGTLLTVSGDFTHRLQGLCVGLRGTLLMVPRDFAAGGLRYIIRNDFGKCPAKFLPETRLTRIDIGRNAPKNF